MAIKPMKKILPKKSVVEEAPEVDEEDEAAAEEDAAEEDAAPAKKVVKKIVKKTPVVDDDEEEAEEEEEDEEEEVAPAKKIVKKVSKKVVEEEDEEEDEEEEVAPAKKLGKKAAPAAPAKKLGKKAAPAAPAKKGKGIVLGGKKAAGNSVSFEIDGTELTVAGELPEDGERISRDMLINIIHENLTVNGLNPETKKQTSDLVDAIEAALIAVTDKYSLKFMGAMFKVINIQERFFPSIIEGASSSLMPAHTRSKYDRKIGNVASIRGELNKKGVFVAAK
jgi:hypothetical protein